jgi:hypothetical protein
MSEIVVNCSQGYYNLGAHKLYNWRLSQAAEVHFYDGDPGIFGLDAERVWLSVIFSWHSRIALEIAWRFMKSAAIEAGGPGMFALKKWWKENTGLECKTGLDSRFENEANDYNRPYEMTFASRGCPVGCYFCIVPKLEGKTFTLNRDFIPAPILCDNNISALPADFQEHVLMRYSESSVILLDCNSGFEPMTFDEGTYSRWRGKFKGPWRFAFDTTAEEPQVRRMMGILESESPKRKQVYVLIGNEPVEQCIYRAQRVIEWGGEPYCQPLLPLNAMNRLEFSIRYDWASQKLRDVARFYNRHLWRSMKLSEYKPRQNEPAFSV